MSAWFLFFYPNNTKDENNIYYLLFDAGSFTVLPADVQECLRVERYQRSDFRG